MSKSDITLKGSEMGKVDSGLGHVLVGPDVLFICFVIPDT